jgi:hypothetical protein
MKVNLNAVPLIGSDPLAGLIKRETLLIIPPDNFFQLGKGEIKMVSPACGQ